MSQTQKGSPWISIASGVPNNSIYCTCIRLISIDRDSPVAFSLSAAAFSRRLEEAASASTVSDNSRSSSCKAAFAAAFFLRAPTVALRNSGLWEGEHLGCAAEWGKAESYQPLLVDRTTCARVHCVFSLSCVYRSAQQALCVDSIHDTAEVKRFRGRLYCLLLSRTVFPTTFRLVSSSWYRVLVRRTKRQSRP